MKKKIIVLISIVLLIIVVIFSTNYFSLQRHMNNVLSDDSRNKGIKVWVHYKWFINPTELTYDLRTISNDNSPLDVNRVMLQFAEKVQDREFKKVYLSYNGEDKFYFKGGYFQNLGKEYGVQNPIYTLRTLPENVYQLNGELKYGVWEGGWLGVMGKQMEDLNSFAEDWFLNDLVTE